MARKFLYVIAFLVVLGVAGLVAYRLFGPELLRLGLVPSAAFVEQKAMPRGTYADAKMWHARPDIAGNAALWLPEGYAGERSGDAAIFFIHPTSYIDRSAWNAPLDDPAANQRARLFIRGQATAFNGVGEIWAPKYRQATFGAFLTTQAEAELALSAAYRDVIAAWDHFYATVDSRRPIIIAGHSQGSLHLLRLLRERVAGKPAASRIVAAYAVGWPISVAHDLPALGLPACNGPDDASCILSWQSFAEPADPSLIVDTLDATAGFDGQSRRGSKLLCTNPLTGTPDRTAAASANLGNLVPSDDFATATLETGKIPARCDPRGFLLIGGPPANIGSYVLPGNNYHVFDYSLFWGNVRADAARRLASFQAR